MAAASISPSGTTRWLNAHAHVVGVGWFLVAFVGLLSLYGSNGARDWVGSWSAVVQGIGGTILLVAAIPFVWPIYIAVGLREAGLASLIRSGDGAARRSAVRLLHAQALAFALGSVMAGAVAWVYRDSGGAEYAVLAWLPLATIAALHLQTAKAVTR